MFSTNSFATIKNKQFSEKQCKLFIQKIESLTKIKLPQKKILKWISTKPWNHAIVIQNMRVVSHLNIEDIEYFTVTPNGSECLGYGISSCINFITNNKGILIFTDIALGKSIGMPISRKKDYAVYSFSAGEGDRCGSFFTSTSHIVDFKNKKVYMQAKEESKYCQGVCPPCKNPKSRLKVSYQQHGSTTNTIPQKWIQIFEQENTKLKKEKK